jgi:hypothetical protein
MAAARPPANPLPGSAERQLMPPPPAPPRSARKRAAQTVLPEDDYVDAMARIVERDFFPELPRLRLKHAYYTALEQNDLARAAMLSDTYQALGATPGSIAQKKGTGSGSTRIPAIGFHRLAFVARPVHQLGNGPRRGRMGSWRTETEC